jgi:iron complex transport system substrate-binding protein
MKKSILAIPILLIVGLILSIACVPTAPPKETKPPASPPIETKPPAVSQPEPEVLPSFPLTVTDDLGRKVTIAKLPQRIISLAPSNTEILFALGLGDKIVGVTDYCDYPEAAKTKPRVAGYSTPNIEKLISTEPDLVLAESIHEKTVLPALERLGLAVIITKATSIDTVLHEISLIGQVNGKSKAATKLVDSMTQRINTITNKTNALNPEQRLRVLYAVWHDPIWTMGSETFSTDLITMAGGTNIFANDFKESRVVSLESVITKNPQVILVSGMGTSGDLIYNGIKNESRLNSVDALVNKRLYKISDANLVERPGPRIVDGLEEVAKLIHPEIFGALNMKSN